MTTTFPYLTGDSVINCIELILYLIFCRIILCYVFSKFIHQPTCQIFSLFLVAMSCGSHIEVYKVSNVIVVKRTLVFLDLFLNVCFHVSYHPLFST